MKVWIVKLTGNPTLQWHDSTGGWDESWIGACYETEEKAEAASVIAAAHSPENIGRIRVAPFDVGPSDMWLALMRKKKIHDA